MLMIIGLVGQNCAGKDTAAEVFVSKGFERYSLSDYLRREVEKSGAAPNRENLIALGNKLRAEKGAGYLAEKALEFMKEGKNYVVVSIRNPEEARVLMRRKDFLLIAVEAPAEVRFQRMKSRDRGENDPQTLEEFLRLEEKENAGGAKQNIRDTMHLATHVIDASGSIHDELIEVENLCKKLGFM